MPAPLPRPVAPRGGAPRPTLARLCVLPPAVAVLLGAVGCGDRSVPGIDVAVAANFAEVAERLAERFTRETGVPVRLAVGSTGGLTTQILSGAPYHLFLAADTVRPSRLEAEGAAVAGTRFTYAVGRLVVLAPGRRDDWTLPELLGERGLRVAWPDPRTAPYGAAAIEALDRWGLTGLEGAVATSVAQSWQFAASGAVDAAFVALAQVARHPAAERRLVPDSLYAPIRQQAVLLRLGEQEPAARDFLAFLRSAEVRRAIRESGYEVMEDDRVG